MEISAAFIAQAREFLSNEFLPKIEHCVESLSDEQVWWRANQESNSIGNLMLHLCGNVQQWIVCGLGGQVDQRERQLEFDQREVIPRSAVLARLTETVAEADQVLAKLDPTQLLITRVVQGSEVTALEAVFHVTEHFSMHAGQIVLLTKILAKKDLAFYDFSTGKPIPQMAAVPSE